MWVDFESIQRGCNGDKELFAAIKVLVETHIEAKKTPLDRLMEEFDTIFQGQHCYEEHGGNLKACVRKLLAVKFPELGGDPVSDVEFHDYECPYCGLPGGH